MKLKIVNSNEISAKYLITHHSPEFVKFFDYDKYDLITKNKFTRRK